MITLTPKTLSPFSFLCNPIPKHQNQNSKYTIVTQYSDSSSKPTFNSNCESEFQTERGLKFDIGETFFRHESATGRDLGVLAAALYKRSKDKLRVLDALCGCGIRSLRYLIEAEADFVLANDANDDNGKVITENLSQVESSSGDDPRWAVTLLDANRIMTECYLKRDFFDLIDIDSFGSDSSFLRSAINALKLDGLLYVTSTDGFSSGGRRPQQTLAAYGAYVRPMPYSNELGLRMLIGGAVRVASVLGYRVTPLFSYYSYHGPIFRVMLRVNRGKLPDNRNYGFISYCHNCGSSQEYSWAELGRMSCPCSDSKVQGCVSSLKFALIHVVVSKSLVVSGPLWTGPLHDTVYITEMLHLAEEWGWAGSGSRTDLDKLLNQMVAESDPRLPFGYTKLDEVASRAKVNSPPLRAVMSTLEKEGYAASRSHIESNAIKTNCSMAGCIRIAKQLQQCSSAE
ncbi:PREDICTED: tRNA (guanine(26)-N(2))-dimethyltransferase isoform X1 [Prunus mume]|uniref:tRNA (guanine(26)-N(2))-dimethyltransferase n=1 Tax=Prunus mume TaxID=102107 RepID=A0ABM0P3J0_PRUMU|nr:PREDICTED: tRNA (guanine(26)-N(2))-dimethyltransferase isoform X1 [Prunus mume]